MGDIQSEIQEIEMMLDSMSGESANKGDLISELFKGSTLEEMKKELGEIQGDFKSLDSYTGQGLYDMQVKITNKIEKLKMQMDIYIKGGELTRVLKTKLQEIEEDAKEVEESQEDLEYREEQLEKLKARHSKLLEYINEAKIKIDTSKAETEIARVILSIIQEKINRGQDVDVKNEISDVYAHEVVQVIREKASSEKDIEGDSKELAEAILQKMQIDILKEARKKDGNVAEVAYDEVFMLN